METRDWADLRRRFVLPRGLAQGVPRDVRLTAAGRLVYLGAVLLLATSVFAGILIYERGVQERDDRRALAETGVDTDARVVRLWRDSDTKKQAWAAYRFTAGGRDYQGQVRMPVTTWRTLAVGAVLPVRYVPGHPDLNVPSGTDRRALPLWVPYAAATPLAIAGLLCLFAVRIERELLANGRPTPAVVTGLRQRRSSEGGTHRSIAYDFSLLSGAQASGKASVSSKPPAIGTVICVVYDPERPKRSKPYPFQLVSASVE